MTGNFISKYKDYKKYFLFVLLACGGAFFWQFFYPNLGEDFAIWGSNIGWQREIALWNLAIIFSILIALKKNNIYYMEILIIQLTILFIVLGSNHIFVLSKNFQIDHIIHILGAIEVLLIGGIWGLKLVIKYSLF